MATSYKLMALEILLGLLAAEVEVTAHLAVAMNRFSSTTLEHSAAM